MIYLLAFTGARRGEILGLKWSAVDFTNNRVHIINTIMCSKERGIYEETPKSKESNRWITIPAVMTAMLRQWKAAQKMEMNRLKGYYVDRDFVFAQENGNPMRPDSMNVWMKHFSKRHNLPHINPHAFRHTMASILIFKHTDDLSLSSRLGHYSAAFSKKQYGHLFEQADQNNADILAEVILKNA